jgi:site-specific DNA-methyltransferase (adenine-specific)
MTWGVGALNIDGCRVGDSGGGTHCNNRDKHGKCKGHKNAGQSTSGETFHADEQTSPLGRWPANVIFDEEAAQMLDAQSGHGASRFFYVAKASKAEREAGLDGMEVRQMDESRQEGNPGGDNPRNRGVHKRANHHPTVKPITLMRYLVRLVTPPGGTVLDPFMGSGSTGCAAMLEAMQFIGIELSAEYIEIARRRIEFHEYTVREKNPLGL